jgi:chromatin remodeling complex protein RSC6
MPKKSTTTSVSEDKQATPAVVAPVAPAPKRTRKAPEQTVAKPADSSSAVSSGEAKSRVVPTRESVEREFDELVASIDEEIGKLRETASKSKGVKFLRTINKRVKMLKNHALRISRQRQTTRRNNTNSGFLKPVQISQDLANFTGWDKSTLRSRVDVTKYICQYIKERNLQDPTDKRQIRAGDDPKLRALLKYDPAKESKPLTYYSLQTYLKSHFVPVATPAVAPAVVPAPVAPAKASKKVVATA